MAARRQSKIVRVELADVVHQYALAIEPITAQLIVADKPRSIFCRPRSRESGTSRAHRKNAVASGDRDLSPFSFHLDINSSKESTPVDIWVPPSLRPILSIYMNLYSLSKSLRCTVLSQQLGGLSRVPARRGSINMSGYPQSAVFLR
jgi:hypothetical protein